MSYIITLFSACIDWFSQIFTATNTVNIFIACFSIVVVFRFLIKPIIGGLTTGGSDKAKFRSKSKGSETNE